MPQNAAGIRIEPPPSPPSDIVPAPEAIAAAAPPEEPPQVRLLSQGLVVAPYNLEVVVPIRLNSGQVVFAKITAPARSKRSIAAPLCSGTKDC